MNLMGQKYATCSYCKQIMSPSTGCKVCSFHVDGKTYERIKAGDDLDFDPNMDEGDLCHDCFVGLGQYHHYGCDAEQCPFCHEQLIGCNCEFEIEQIA